MQASLTSLAWVGVHRRHFTPAAARCGMCCTLPVLVQIRHADAQGLKNAVEEAKRVGMTDPMGWKEQANIDRSGSGEIHPFLVSTTVAALLFINEYYQLMDETDQSTDGPKQGCTSLVAPTQTHAHTYTRIHNKKAGRRGVSLAANQPQPKASNQAHSLAHSQSVQGGWHVHVCQTAGQWR